MDAYVLKIAVIGETGTGKSSLINAIRGLHPKHNNAAAVGVIETTTDIRRYPHPVCTHLEFWDLPGVGTPKFTQRTYLNTIKLETYDCFILTSQSRFKENDAWLAREIGYLQKRFYFVRTMIDIDVVKDKISRPQTHDPVKVIEDIRQECIAQLLESCLLCPDVFLINNYSPDEFDFMRLTQKLVQDASEIKKEALARKTLNRRTIKTEDKSFCTII